jgi:protein-tyrosine phosphatase
MRDHAHKRGLLLQHRSRPLEAGDFDIFDRMFVMDQRNLQDVTTMAKHENKKDALKKIFMCTAFSEKYAMQDIPDPYYQGDEGFELVLDMLDEACECIILSLAAV